MISLRSPYSLYNRPLFDFRIGPASANTLVADLSLGKVAITARF